VPAFYRAGGKHLAHFVDPDRWKNREMNFLRREEEGNHSSTPKTSKGRTAGHAPVDAMKMIYTDLKKERTRRLLPYALMENYEKLVLAFYDYPQGPEEPGDPDEVLVHAAYSRTTPATRRCRCTPLRLRRQEAGRRTVKQRAYTAKWTPSRRRTDSRRRKWCRGLEAKKIETVWVHVNKFIAESRTSCG